MAYYPDWVGDSFPPEKIDFRRFDWVDFAFALPTSDFSLTWDDPSAAPGLLQRLVNAAHANGKKVKLSVGGWTGSKHFSSAVATPQSRLVFASNILAIYEWYKLDGIDIDWEYPGHPGNDGNKVNPLDSDNFLSFLQCLRQLLPLDARITAATQTEPFVGVDGRPMQDVTTFANVLDWILIMNYDIWSSSPDPGPNAPMYDACNNSSQPNANAAAAFNAWTKAGFPASKITLGLPSYGYVSDSSNTELRTRSLHHSRRNSTSAQTSSIKVESDGGSIQFRELVQQGALTADANSGHAADYRTFSASGGYTKRWDSCSSTPYLVSASANQVISYDDPHSLAMKSKLVKATGMAGINMFDVHGDTDEWDLVDAIRGALELLVVD
ncbi:glycoside hydrolase [Infundibulicybe gibba]|nr:glycoside hydrolase [Infundibulicybe gibba]